MKACFQLLMAMSVLITLNVNANETDEVIVTASFIDQKISEIENPLHVVDGDDVAENFTQSLGESLDGLLGVSSTDYGPAVGQPIIRGMSGNRVKILNNGMVVRDLSGIGGDHINDVDLNDIQQIEVVRGPSSLLYSNGTMGGIINIVDNTIPKKDLESLDLKVGAENQSVNDGDSHNLSFANNLGGINLTLAYKDSKFGNFDIPSGAIIHTEEEHEEEGHEEEGHEEEHEENPEFLANSDYESEALRFGLSKVAEWGYIGASYTSVESLYGIPFHGEEHEEEGHDEEGHEEEEHEDERIFSTTDTDVFNVEGSYAFRDSFINKADFYFRDTDSSLTEQHDEEAHEDEDEDEHEDEHEGHSEGPTLFKNDAKEYGMTFDIGNEIVSQKIAVKSADEAMSIIGSEAFMNPTDSDELSVGYYLSVPLNAFHLDFGVRHDKVSRKGSVTHREEEDHEDEHEDEHEEEIDYFNRDINSTSYAFSISNDLNDFISINLGLSYLARAPSAVELFINGPHLATGRLEVGNTNLKAEESNNFDLTLNYENSGLFASLTLFQNDIDNYIYLLDETEDDHEEHEDEHEHEGLILANYMQKNAEMDGYELEIGNTFGFYRGELLVSFGFDSVSAEFSDGSNIPRIAPERSIYKITYSEEDLKILLSYKDIGEQDDVGLGETSTAGYDMLDMRVTKTIEAGNGTLNISVFGSNLLDEVARNHSSFVKNEVPLAGRSYGAKFTYKF